MMSQSDTKLTRALPDVETENDIPFSACEKDKPDDCLSIEQNLSIDAKKFNLGSNTLGWCIFLMSGCVILSVFVPNEGLIEEAFDAFKLIVMTILGYIFGSERR